MSAFVQHHNNLSHQFYSTYICVRVYSVLSMPVTIYVPVYHDKMLITNTDKFSLILPSTSVYAATYVPQT